MVEPAHQRPEFVLHFHQWQWPQVIGLALFDCRAQTLQRTQCGADGKPDQQQGTDRQHTQTQQRIGRQTARHADAGFVGFGHADFRHAIHVRLAHRFEQADHAHVLSFVSGIVETRQRRIAVSSWCTGRWPGEVFVAGNQLLMNVVDLVVNPSGAVVSEGIEGHIRHVGTEAAITLRQASGDGSRRRQQRAVVRRVGRLASIPVSTQAAGEHQHHQQRRQVPQQPPTQAAGLMHRGFPADSRGRGRSRSRPVDRRVSCASGARRFRWHRGWPLHQDQTPARPVALCS